MKKIKGIIVIFCCLFLVFCYFLSSKKQEVKIVQNKNVEQGFSSEGEFKIIYENNIQKEYSSLEEELYDKEYERGRKNLYKQMGVLIVDKNESNFDYTVIKEVPEEEKNKYEEIMNKAYVDGYHKASESFYCPRQE